MKKFILSVVGLFLLVARLSATIVVDANVLTILNDRDQYMQYLLERVDRGVVEAGLSFAAGERQKSVGFEVRNQVSYHGLVASVPEISFTTVNSREDLYVGMWGDFFISNDKVFGFGGGTRTGEVSGGAVFGVDGWIQLHRILIQVGNVDSADLYYRTQWGDLRRVDKVADSTLDMDPALVGRLVMAIVSKDGVVKGYDYLTRRTLSQREVGVRLSSLQGDVILGDLLEIRPGLGFGVTTQYWVDDNTGTAVGTMPVVELKVGQTGKFLYNHRLETGYDRPHNIPQIVGFQVWYLDPTAEKQLWVPVPSTSADSESGVVNPRNRVFTFDVNRPGLYRIKLYTEGLVALEGGGGKG